MHPANVKYVIQVAGVWDEVLEVGSGSCMIFHHLHCLGLSLTLLNIQKNATIRTSSLRNANIYFDLNPPTSSPLVTLAFSDSSAWVTVTLAFSDSSAWVTVTLAFSGSSAWVTQG